MTNFEKVGTFMKTFGQEVKLKASLSSDKINLLRLIFNESSSSNSLFRASNKNSFFFTLPPGNS